MKKYEYRVIYMYDNGEIAIQENLNKYGNEGWELINIRRETTYIFKREKNEDYNKKDGI